MKFENYTTDCIENVLYSKIRRDLDFEVESTIQTCIGNGYLDVIDNEDLEYDELKKYFDIASQTDYVHVVEFFGKIIVAKYQDLKDEYYKYLLNHGGKLALIRACIRNDTELIQFFTDNGHQIDAENDHFSDDFDKFITSPVINCDKNFTAEFIVNELDKFELHGLQLLYKQEIIEILKRNNKQEMKRSGVPLLVKYVNFGSNTFQHYL